MARKIFILNYMAWNFEIVRETKEKLCNPKTLKSTSASEIIELMIMTVINNKNSNDSNN